jgi:hypothetical protein
MSASIEVVEEITEFPLKSALLARISQFRRLLADEAGCAHNRLVFDDINDVHCDHCGKDFTG